MQAYAFAEHDGLDMSLDHALTRVGVGAEYTRPLWGPVDAFAAVEASVGRDAPSSKLSLDVQAKAGFEVRF